MLCLVIAFIGFGWGASTARAQGTTVQLPTYRTFRSNSAVLVPDRGSAYLGGVNRARSGRNEFGTPLAPFRNRASGSEVSASGTSVSAFIHDFAAMEEELQRAARGQSAGAGSPDPATGPTAGLRKRKGDLRSTASAGSGDPRRALGPGDPRRTLESGAPRRTAGETPLVSVEEIRRQRRLEEEARLAEARDFFERGQAAEEAGKANVARIYYQMAAKRASGTFKDEVLARLDSLRGGQTSHLARQEGN